VGVPGHEVAGRYCAAGAWGRDKTEFWGNGFAHVAKAHQRTCLEAERLHLSKELPVVIKLLSALMACQAKARSTRNNKWHGHIHAGHFDAINHIHKISGWQERACGTAHGFLELQRYRSGCAGHAIDMSVALIGDDAAWGLHSRRDFGASIHRVDVHLRLFSGRGNQGRKWV